MTRTQTGTEARRLFWRAFRDWLAGAEIDELDALERTLDGFEHLVRPLIAAMDEALLHPEASAKLPQSLMQAFREAGYVPQPPPAQAEQAPPKVA